MLRVAALWRYPVKSLQGEPLDVTDVGPHGFPGDRSFGIVDEATGNVLTARREPQLLFARARWHDGEVEVTDTEGRALDTDRALSAWLGRDVHLARAGETGGTYENPMDTEHESDWIAWQGPGHAWHDSRRARVSLVSTATLGTWAPARFRANVVLDGDGEDALVGRQVRLGTATLDVVKPIDRCVMVTRAQPGLDIDRDVLRAIHRDRDGNLAVGALVAERGAVAVGEPLTAVR